MKTIPETERFLTFATQSGQVKVCSATIGAPVNNQPHELKL